MQRTLVLTLFLAVGPTWAGQPTQQPTLIARPEAFHSLFSPDCSHCTTEGLRRKDELRADDRALCFRQVFNDGYTNDGAIPIRFFLNTHRVLSDSWGVFVYDPDAGYARGFRPHQNESRLWSRGSVMSSLGKARNVAEQIVQGDGPIALATMYTCPTSSASARRLA